jgi:hypothetical protein
MTALFHWWAHLSWSQAMVYSLITIALAASFISILRNRF